MTSKRTEGARELDDWPPAATRKNLKADALVLFLTRSFTSGSACVEKNRAYRIESLGQDGEILMRTTFKTVVTAATLFAATALAAAPALAAGHNGGGGGGMRGGGGFHGGGFHNGGFRGGFHNGGFRGFRGGFRGWHGGWRGWHGWGWRGWGWGWWGPGFAFGYYPWYWGPYAYDVGVAYPYDDGYGGGGGSDYDSGPSSGGGDRARSDDFSCSAWHWDAQARRYVSVRSACN